eukprot:6862989-Prymnesium_polylepis.1
MLEAASGETVWETAGLGGEMGVNIARFWSDDTKVVCGDAQCKLTVLEATSGEKLWEAVVDGKGDDVGGSGVTNVSVSSDDTKIVCSSSDQVTVLEAASGDKVSGAALGGMVSSVAFSTDNTKVVCCDGRKVTVLEAASGEKLWEAELVDEPACPVGFKSDDTQI